MDWDMDWDMDAYTPLDMDTDMIPDTETCMLSDCKKSILCYSSPLHLIKSRYIAISQKPEGIEISSFSC